LRHSLMIACLMGTAAFHNRLTVDDGLGGAGGDSTTLKTNGPTLAEYIAEGEDPANYPPAGYAAKNADGSLVVAGGYADDDQQPDAVAWRASQQAEAITNGTQTGGGAEKATALAAGDIHDAVSQGGTTGLGAADLNASTAQIAAAKVRAATLGTAPSTVTDNATMSILGLSVNQAVTLISMVAGAAFPGATVAGFTIAQLAGIGLGVANEVPEALAAYDEIKQVAASGLPPTAEQWASWNAAADAAHNDFNSAADAVINGTGP
jgi:hypothetical protein